MRRGPKFFERGHLYRPRIWVGAPFHRRQRLIFVGTNWSRYDSLFGIEFMDTAGRFHRHECPLGDEVGIKYHWLFKGLGPDMVLCHVRLDELNFAQVTDWNVFAPFTDYLKALVEGREGIASWFLFLDQQKAMLAPRVTRADFLRLRFEGHSQSQLVLERLGVSFDASPRYSWIGSVRPAAADRTR